MSQSSFGNIKENTTDAAGINFCRQCPKHSFWEKGRKKVLYPPGRRSYDLQRLDIEFTNDEGVESVSTNIRLCRLPSTYISKPQYCTMISVLPSIHGYIVFFNWAVILMPCGDSLHIHTQLGVPHTRVVLPRCVVACPGIFKLTSAALTGLQGEPWLIHKECHVKSGPCHVPSTEFKLWCSAKRRRRPFSNSPVILIHCFSIVYFILFH